MRHQDPVDAALPCKYCGNQPGGSDAGPHMIWVGCHSDDCDEEPMTDGDYLTIEDAIADWDRLFGAPYRLAAEI